MPLEIIRQDITKMSVDAIVNAANTALQMGGGVCGAIFKAAGVDKLQAACNKLAPIQTGEAVITPGFNLPAKYIIHTAGPVYRDGKHGEAKLLRSCYVNSLKRALENNCESVAFPLISSGIYGYPKDKALDVAVSAIREYLETHDMDIYLTVFSKEALKVSLNLLGEVARYIDEHYVEERWDIRRDQRLLDVEIKALNRTYEQATHLRTSISAAQTTSSFEIIDEPFSKALLKLIDSKGMTDVEVYKRANLTRQLFHTIRTHEDYVPSKKTALALSIALKLSLEETECLIRRAGYALSHSSKMDIIIEYFIINDNYSIDEINKVLFEYDQPLLGARID